MCAYNNHCQNEQPNEMIFSKLEFLFTEFLNTRNENRKIPNIYSTTNKIFPLLFLRSEFPNVIHIVFAFYVFGFPNYLRWIGIYCFENGKLANELSAIESGEWTTRGKGVATTVKLMISNILKWKSGQESKSEYILMEYVYFARKQQ